MKIWFTRGKAKLSETRLILQAVPVLILHTVTKHFFLIRQSLRENRLFIKRGVTSGKRSVLVVSDYSI